MSEFEPYRLKLVTGPKSDPVSESEAKAHCRIDETASNPVLPVLIKAATSLCEGYARRSFIARTYQAFFDCWPKCSHIDVPKAPLMSVTHIKTYDNSDASVTMSAADYFVDTASQRGRIVLRSQSSWPTYSRTANGIEVQFVSGYATEPKDIPAEIKLAILMTVAHLYEHRGDANMDLPESAMVLLGPHRDWMI